MPYRYLFTNISESSPEGKRSVFMIETGQLLRPGESCPSNRIEPGTDRLKAAGVLKIEDGEFRKPLDPPLRAKVLPIVAKPYVEKPAEEKLPDAEKWNKEPKASAKPVVPTGDITKVEDKKFVDLVKAKSEPEPKASSSKSPFEGEKNKSRS